MEGQAESDTVESAVLVMKNCHSHKDTTPLSYVEQYPVTQHCVQIGATVLHEPYTRIHIYGPDYYKVKPTQHFREIRFLCKLNISGIISVRETWNQHVTCCVYIFVQYR